MNTQCRPLLLPGLKPMGLSSDEDELNVVDNYDDGQRKVKSVASSASNHADRSDFSTTPDESVSLEHQKPQTEIGGGAVKRPRTQKRPLTSSSASEKRLIEKLMQENQKLKTELETRTHHQFQSHVNPQSVIVGPDAEGQTSTSLVHPTPRRPLEPIDPATFSLFYSPFSQQNQQQTSPPSLLSLFGGHQRNIGVGQYDMASLNNLHAILQQQQRQQALFSNFAASTTSTNSTVPTASTQEQTPLSHFITQTDPLLSIFQNTTAPSAFTSFRGSTSQPNAANEAMRFNSLFTSGNHLHQPTTVETEASNTGKKKAENQKLHKPRKEGSSPESSGAVARGPGNVQFIGHLPTAQEPRASVLVHTDQRQQLQSLVDTNQKSSTRKSPQQKREKNSPRSASAFSALPEHNGLNHSVTGQIQQQINAERPQSLLGSLLATSSSRRSPSVPESRTEKQSGLVEQMRAEQDRLTSLAVNLSTQRSNQTSTQCHRSDNDSVGSPHSTRSTTDSNRSQISPPLGSSGQDNSSNAQTSTTEGQGSDNRLEHERYIDRRRRNNEAAKRCRANRRAVFEYRSRRAQQLEAENADLRQEMIKLNNELEQLKAVIAANNRLIST